MGVLETTVESEEGERELLSLVLPAGECGGGGGAWFGGLRDGGFLSLSAGEALEAREENPLMSCRVAGDRKEIGMEAIVVVRSVLLERFLGWVWNLGSVAQTLWTLGFFFFFFKEKFINNHFF